MRALTHEDQFAPGTNFKAWITRILRNAYFSEMRRRGRATRVSLDFVDTIVATSGGQVERLHGRDCRRALNALPAAQREALLLVGASGFSYEEAGQIAGCAVGTMKSRVSRARSRLQETLDGTDFPLSCPSLRAADFAHGGNGARLP